MKIFFFAFTFLPAADVAVKKKNINRVVSGCSADALSANNLWFMFPRYVGKDKKTQDAFLKAALSTSCVNILLFSRRDSTEGQWSVDLFILV